MKIKIYASVKKASPTPGPYKTIDIVERESLYQVGDMTRYGEVILLLPSVMWLNYAVERAHDLEGKEQGKVVASTPIKVHNPSRE